MSDFRAIGGVSSTLRQLLLNRMQNPVEVTIAPPDVNVSTAPGKRVNLFLYRVDENPFLKNMDLPGEGNPGAYGRPPLSLELCYLLTAYGDSEENQVATHEILGDAMRVIHDHAIVGGSLLDPSLRDEFEQVKITLDHPSMEDLTKIWSSLNMAYRTSAAYKVTVVQIASRTDRAYPPRVAEPPAAGPRVVATTFRTPHIRQILVRRQDDPTNQDRPLPYARIGDTVILLGMNFSGEARVQLGSVDATSSILSRSDERIEVTVPDDVELQPGGLAVKVQMDVLLGDPPTPHRGFQSNLGVFALCPGAATLTPDLAPVPPTLEIAGSRLFQPDRESLTLVGPHVIRADNYTSATPTLIRFNLPAALASGAHPVRVRVNGVESFEERTLTIP